MNVISGNIIFPNYEEMPNVNIYIICNIHIYIYIYIYNNNNNKIKFGNCLGEGRSRAYKFSPIYDYEEKN